MDIPDLPPPSPTQLQLKMLAAAVPRVVKARALGKHPSAFSSPLPYDPSVDGVALDETTGEKYYLTRLAAPLFAERVNVEKTQLVKLDKGCDPVGIAALANPAMSSWLALNCRVVGGVKGRTVVILGATSASGRAAAVVARGLGAKKVVGVSRDEEMLKGVKGLDERVVSQSPLSLPASVGPVHVVLDYVGGPIAVEAMRAAEVEEGENLQYVQVGGLAGEEELVLPMRLLNVKAIRVMASGIGSVSKGELVREIPGLVEVLGGMEVPFGVEAVPMEEVERVWEGVGDKRLVLIP